MSTCSMCDRKATSAHPLLLNESICNDCSQKINNNDYHINVCNPIINENISNQDHDTSDMVFIDASYNSIKLSEEHVLSITRNKLDNQMNSSYDLANHFNIDDVIPVCTDRPPVETNFKDALLASLYSQIEFLRSELEEVFFHTFFVITE